MERISQIKNHLKPNQTGLPKKSGDDVVICSAVRTALTKSKRGGLKDTPSERLIAEVLKEAIKRAKVDPTKIEDITIGNVMQPGSGFMISRMAQFLAGIPYETSISTCNRLCSSGLEACSNIAAKIRDGYIGLGIAGGFENMSHLEMESTVPAPDQMDEEVFEVEHARNCLMGMGQTSENVATKYGITRKQADLFGLESQKKALAAQKNGLYKEEILPIKTFIKVKDQDGNEVKKDVFVDKDDGIRETTLEGLTKLKPAFKKDGVSTAGNSSQVEIFKI
jgi:acetyl-CoA acyltransferase 1